MKKLLFVCSVLTALVSAADVESVSLTGWTGTAYHDKWFTYGLPEVYAESGAAKLTATSQFILSPTYAKSIRKVVLKLYNSSASPKRALCVTPLVKGVETGDASLERTLEAPVTTSGFFYAHFDWNASEDVTALRLHLGSGSDGNWGVAEVHVFYGERTAKEDEVLGQLLDSLPPPANPTVVDFTTDSLTAAADPVARAGGYRFALYRLDGLPRQEHREDFAAAPACSGGWTLTSSNVKLGKGSEGYADKKVPSDKGSLYIEKLLDADKDASVDILSPVVEAPVSACSFMCRVGATDKSDRFAVYGRSSKMSDWKTIATNVLPTAKGSNKYFNYSVDVSNDYRQIRFSFTATNNSFTVAGLDSLCVVCGGNETRTLVGDAVETESPTNRFDNLPNGRYVFRVCAVSASGTLKDSPPTEESEAIDLSWANLEVSAAQNVTLRASGENLTVSWDPVAGAVWYLLDVVPEDDPESPVVSGLKVVGCRETVVVPAVGTYVVRVTAVAPCAKSQAVSETVACAVPLGRMGPVTASATDKTTILATWEEVPLAESYRVRLERVSGTAEKEVPDFSGLPGVWPSGWSHYSYDTEKYAGPAAKMKYEQSWIVTRAYGQPITEAVFKLKSHATSEAVAGEVARTFLVVSGSASDDGDWMTLGSYPVTTAMQTFALTLPASSDVRRLRFALDYQGDNPDYRNAVNVEFLVSSVTTGEVLATPERTVSTTAEAATFGGLDPAARYRVVVAPQPGDESVNESVSTLVDLEAEHFRETGAVSLSRLSLGTYAEDFACLSNVTGGVEARKTNLDFWQFYKGAGETEKLLYQNGTNKVSTGGVYVCRDKGEGEDDLMLGLQATGSAGCSTGLAFRNDSARTVRVEEISFDWVQRAVRGTAVTNVLEWIVTDGATEIGAKGEWNEIVAARQVSEPVLPTATDLPLRRTVTLTQDLPSEIPAGGVLILRWREDKIVNAPLMAIDALTIRFPDTASKGVRLVVR